jgi:hypothetical protein
LNRPGKLQVSAYSEPAKNSTILQLQVGEKPGFITAVSPTNSLEYTPTFAPTPTQSAAGNGGQNEPDHAGWDTLTTLLLVLGVFSAAIIVLTNQPAWNAFRLRILLGCLVGGLAGYDLIVIGFSGSNGPAVWGGKWLGVVIGMIGGILGGLLGWGSMKGKKG